MQRQFSGFLAIFLVVIICRPAVWGDENPKAIKTGNEVERKPPFRVLAGPTPDAAKTDPSDVQEDRFAVAAPEAAVGDVTVSWKGGQLTFPGTSGKASGLKLQCTGNVIIKGKGITVETTDLDAKIEENGAIGAASNLSLGCTGSVVIAWKGLTAIAHGLQYDAEKGILALSSGEKPNGCILGSKNKDGTNAVLIADQISLSPLSNRVSCVGVREYRAADSAAIGQYQAAIVAPAGGGYYPPGPRSTPTLPPPYAYPPPTAIPSPYPPPR